MAVPGWCSWGGKGGKGPNNRLICSLVPVTWYSTLSFEEHFWRAILLNYSQFQHFIYHFPEQIGDCALHLCWNRFLVETKSIMLYCHDTAQCISIISFHLVQDLILRSQKFCPRHPPGASSIDSTGGLPSLDPLTWPPNSRSWIRPWSCGSGSVAQWVMWSLHNYEQLSALV